MTYPTREEYVAWSLKRRREDEKRVLSILRAWGLVK